MSINLLNPTHYFMYYQILHLQILHTEYIAFVCFVWPSEQTVPSASYIINIWVFIIEVESVYSVVRTESLCYIDTSCLLRFKVPVFHYTTHL